MRAMKSTRRKFYASEEKCSWSDDMSLEASSSEARSPEAEVHQKMRDLKLQRMFKGFNHARHCRRPEV